MLDKKFRVYWQNDRDLFKSKIKRIRKEKLCKLI